MWPYCYPSRVSPIKKITVYSKFHLLFPCNSLMLWYLGFRQPHQLNLNLRVIYCSPFIFWWAYTHIPCIELRLFSTTMISASNLQLIRTHAALILVWIFFTFPHAQVILQGLVFLNFCSALPLLPAFESPLRDRFFYMHIHCATLCII